MLLDGKTCMQSVTFLEGTLKVVWQDDVADTLVVVSLSIVIWCTTEVISFVLSKLLQPRLSGRIRCECGGASAAISEVKGDRVSICWTCLFFCSNLSTTFVGGYLKEMDSLGDPFCSCDLSHEYLKVLLFNLAAARVPYGLKVRFVGCNLRTGLRLARSILMALCQHPSFRCLCRYWCGSGWRGGRGALGETGRWLTTSPCSKPFRMFRKLRLFVITLLDLREDLSARTWMALWPK